MLLKIWLFVILLRWQTVNSYHDCGRSTTVKTKNSRSKRIVGGEFAAPNSWPWLVSFVGKTDNSKQYCSGSLIDPYWILTTAHCFVGANYALPVHYWTYIAGNHILDEVDPYEQVLEPTEIFIHPKYVFPNDYFPGDYDIALIRLRSPANITDQVRTICLPNDTRSDSSAEDHHFVVGWGNVYEIRRYNRSRILKQLRVHIIPLDKCNGSLSYGGNITQRQLCAGYYGGGEDACFGDSGGPLQYKTKQGNWIIKGLVSWGRGCARENMYGVYTNVSTLLDYIRETVEGISCGEKKIKSRRKRIIGGQEASINSWPWIVNIVSKESGLQTCGGTIVASNWILTAAHCFGSTDEVSDYSFYVGDHHLNKVEEGEQKVIAESMYVHPGYAIPDFSNPGDYDVALIKLKYSLAWSDKVAPVCLPSALNESTQCFATGWGNVADRHEYRRSKVLKELRVEEVPHAKCNSNTSYNGRIPDTFFCAGFPDGGNDTCYGDSGGPLQCDIGNGTWNLKGIVSWGRGCARPNYYGVYTNVSKIIPFITAIMSGPDLRLKEIMGSTIDVVEKILEEDVCERRVFTIISSVNPKLTVFDTVRTLVLQPIEVTLLRIASPRDVALAFGLMVNATCDKSMTLQRVVDMLTQVRWRYAENNRTLSNTARKINVTKGEIASLLRRTVVSLLLMPNIKSDTLIQEVKEIQEIERQVSARFNAITLQLLRVKPGCEVDLFRLQRAVRTLPYDFVKNMTDGAVKRIITQNHVEVFMEHVELKYLCVFLGQPWEVVRDLSLRQLTVGLLGIPIEVLRKTYGGELFQKANIENTLRQVEVFWNISSMELTIQKILTASKLMEDKYECSNCHENSINHVVNCEVVCKSTVKCSASKCDTNLVHGACSCEVRKTKQNKSSTDKIALIVGVSSGCLVAFLIVGFGCFISKHRSKEKSANAPREKENKDADCPQHEKETSNNNFLPRSKIINGKSGSYVAIDEYEPESMKSDKNLGCVV